MLRRLASTFSTPAATPDRSPSPETPAVDPNTHAGRTAVEHDLAHALRAHGVPTTDEDCFACDAACQDDGPQYDGYPRGFDVDWSSDLLGSANPAPRNLVISTARSDWAHDHTTDTSTLSYHLQTILNAERGFPPPGTPIDPPPANDKSAKEAPKPAPEPVKDDKPPGQIDLVIGKNGLPQGLSETPRAELEPSSIDAKQPPTSLFSSSLISQSSDEHKESVLIFPEWKVICEVPNSSSGAKDVLAGLNGQANELKSWTLPYRAVVLLCSHKKRDKRCHIAAPLLEKALVHELESHHVSIDTRGDSLNPHHLLDMHAALPREGEASEREARLRAIEGLDDETGSGEVGIFKISHLGGHRYSGVMIILFPSGATLYYGRVSPKDIPQVVKHTILKGQVIAGLLRGGNNVVRDELKGDSAGACNKKGKSLMTW